jgi:hypothetical protein
MARGLFKKNVTGEPYQPVRLCYRVLDKIRLLAALSHLQCMVFNKQLDTWLCVRQQETSSIQMLNELAAGDDADVNDGIMLAKLRFTHDDILYVELSSFERAYLLLPYFYRWIMPAVAKIQYADLNNELILEKQEASANYDCLFNDFLLQEMVLKRQKEFNHMLNQPFTQSELKTHLQESLAKPLPKVERYPLKLAGINREADALELLFFTYTLLLQQTIACKHWLGEADQIPGELEKLMSAFLITEKTSF